MSEQRRVRPAPLSGFPEWTPEVRLVELHWLDRIRAAFERYGFCSVETPSVEALEVLLAKGETSQEVYTLHRLQADEADAGEARLGLHFDLTVPIARYVAQHFNDLVFPFKRYQMQRVWRGERPQEGRFREFMQCDVDVIDVDDVALQFDAELARIVCEVLTELGIPPWALHVNNRKVLQGFYQSLGIGDPLAVIRVADKIDKVGVAGVEAMLADDVGLAPEQVRACLDLAAIRGSGAGVVDDVTALGVKSDLLTEGLDELGYVLDAMSDLPDGTVLADLSIARGLDYYTGTVYETRFTDWPDYGSIASGGRYDDLAGSYINRRLPGVGLSIGLTRIFAKLVGEGLLETAASCPTDVLVVVPNAERRGVAVETAARLRERGLRTELYHQADRIGKQLRYASRKGIPYVWFPPFDDGKPHEVKEMAGGDQVEADPSTWRRP
ncbi:MAG: histidine--tRNA ligase [Streptosporangiales bacterium]|nr:histidine--tRNA ligase [Streptosporangiales bacterium]MBO0891597.1 histidine--tRNA ligase [Acidothermales bacterium]